MHPRDEPAASRNAAGGCGLVAGTERMHVGTLLSCQPASANAVLVGEHAPYPPQSNAPALIALHHFTFMPGTAP